MFGFLSPKVHSRKYRNAYSRLCQFQHLHFGLRSLPFLSFEAVFLYICSLDSIAGKSQFLLPNQTCCKLRTSRKLISEPDGEFGKYCSALGVILAATKLEDDIRDSASLTARAYYAFLKKKVRSARNYLNSLDPLFNQKLSSLIEKHLEMEKSLLNTDLNEYTAPTGDAFAYVFGLIAETNKNYIIDKGAFELIGRHIGASIIAFDCAIDWYKDKAKGEFNPLPNDSAIHSAIDSCKDHLLQAAQLWFLEKKVSRIRFYFRFTSASFMENKRTTTPIFSESYNTGD